MYVRVYSKGKDQPGKDQPGKVANSVARGQLNRENVYFPVRVRAREFGLARRVLAVPSRVGVHLFI